VNRPPRGAQAVSGGRPGDSVRRSAGLALASQAVTAGFTAITTVFLVRALGPEEYGLWTLALGFAGLMLLPADFGVSQSAARFIAERRGKPAEIAAVLAEALRLKLILTSLFALLLIALATPIASLYDAPDLAWPLRGVALALFGQSIVLLFAKAFVAMGRIAWQLRLFLSESAVEMTATIAAVLIFGGATSAAFGRVIGYLCGAMLGALLVWRLLGRRAVVERRAGPGLRALGSYAGAMLVVEGAFAVFSQLDVLLVGALLGTTAVGIYGAPLKLTALLHYPGLALGQAIAPRLARHPDHPPDLPAFYSGLRYLIILQTAIAVAIGVWARPIVDLVLGPGYAESAEVLRALAPFVLLQGLGPLVSTSVNYLGEARRRVPIVLGSVLLNLVLIVVLTDAVGVTGAAISVDVSYAVYVGAHLWICARLLDLSMRPLAATAVRTLPAAAALAGVLLALGTSELGVVSWAAGIVGGTAAFLTVLIATRATSVAELVEVPRSVLRGVRRSRA
jgi:O-antigen/teichoic acid export membrane protein